MSTQLNSDPETKLYLLLQSECSESLAKLRQLASRCDLVLTEFHTAEDAQRLCKSDLVGVVAFDFFLPDMVGSQLANWLERNRPSLIPLVSIRSTDARTAIRLASDTRAIVIPDICEELELWEALISARQRAISGRVYENARISLVQRIESCTDEELKILRRWAHGQTNKQIAHEIEISMRTLNFRKNSILQKLRVENIVEAVWELSKYTEFERFSFFPTRKMEIAAFTYSQPLRRSEDRNPLHD
jgi:DNA-binding NarL/FixJ family response regulator